MPVCCQDTPPPAQSPVGLTEPAQYVWARHQSSNGACRRHRGAGTGWPAGQGAVQAGPGGLRSPCSSCHACGLPGPAGRGCPSQGVLPVQGAVALPDSGQKDLPCPLPVRQQHGAIASKNHKLDSCSCWLQGLWSSVWADGAPSTSAALRLYMGDIIPLIHQGGCTGPSLAHPKPAPRPGCCAH